MKKAVFFDIDGTLIDGYMKMPDSTKEALKQLKENGVYIFICSGRTLSFIVNPEILKGDFDGIISGCGTCVTIGEEEILYKTIEPELMKKTLQVLEKYNFPTILEGKYAQYAEEKDFEGDCFFKILKDEVGDKLFSIREYDMKWEISKFCLDIKNSDYEEALQEFGDWFHCIVRGKEILEVLPKGYSKASGMQAVCEKLGISQENTYAFGDSANDIEMLHFAGCGVAMGNAPEEVKGVADYVTDSIGEDGIYKACKHFGLI